MKKIITVVLCFLLFTHLQAQNTVKGVVKSDANQKPLPEVTVSVLGTTISSSTDNIGKFKLQKLPAGEHTITFSKVGYENQNYTVIVSDEDIDLGDVFMLDLFEEVNQDVSIITLTDDELNDDTAITDNIVGLLQASRDLYLRTAAFDFGSSFYSLRGLGSENSTVLLNGIEMNKQINGRPQWSNWDGLNDVTRNQEFSSFLTPSVYTFGGVLGATYINTRPSDQAPGIRISYASANRSYKHRVMATYSSGLLKNNWAFSLSASRRVGEEGFVDGTNYNAYSVFASAEKKINRKHTLSLTSIFAPNVRGKSSSNTQEVFDLKNIKYNSYWGVQNGEIRNSRINKVIEPIIILNHYWNLSDKTFLQTNLAYQWGQIGNSRLEFNGSDINPSSGFPEGSGTNPDPTYYQKLPSYAVREYPDNLGIAYGLQQEFLSNGQINWNSLYQTNIDSAERGENAVFIQYEDRVDDTTLSFNTIMNTKVNDHLTINGSLGYQKLKSQNFANVLDLLGGTGYLDVDTFAQDLENNPDQIQNNVLSPNRIVKTGDTFRYNYTINSNIFKAFAQAQFNYHKLDVNIGINLTQTSYQREGLYQNGGFINTSLGKSEKVAFTGLGIKSGVTYKLTGRHLFMMNAAYLTKAPTINNTFSNSRENNAIVPNISEEKIVSFDTSYVLRLPKIQAKATGFYTQVKDANKISFFYADGIGGDNTAFIQEALQGISTNYIGGEFALEYQATSTFKLKAVAAVGKYTYGNNPDLYISSENFVGDEDADEFGRKYFGKTYLKNYKTATGPQQAFSVGFEYSDPDYWWFGATANFFSNAFIGISPIQRSANFYTDFDGQVFNDYDSELAKQLLTQEKIDSYMVVNLIGGKSWKIKDKYLSVFASVNNLLNTTYKTGGFENGRNANFRQLRDDKALATPVFGSRYWYGRGATYFVNVNVRF
ncbi:carboxypeptidase-like regulatory domain-containing protein [Tenacibaculum geojense]|uniref:Carboxypeptidase-like regulatory domain-containing protein n=1 Tax=Tenacibaculum geojense TaxID=915352 RepID=A0ABW3JUB6_9FLAO